MSKAFDFQILLKGLYVVTVDLGWRNGWRSLTEKWVLFLIGGFYFFAREIIERPAWDLHLYSPGYGVRVTHTLNNLFSNIQRLCRYSVDFLSRSPCSLAMAQDASAQKAGSFLKTLLSLFSFSFP